MDKKKPVIELDDDDFGAILNCAVRYSIGRQSYMPSLVIRYITPLLPHISKKTLEVFKQDYENKKADEEINGFPMFGNSTLWDKFYVNVCAEIERRTRLLKF